MSFERTRIAVAWLGLTVGAVLAACGLVTVGEATAGGDGGSEHSDGERVSPSVGDAAVFDGTSVVDSGREFVIYVNSEDALYRVDGTTGGATMVARMSGGCGGFIVWDVALDRDGMLYGSLRSRDGGNTALATIDRVTGACAPPVGTMGAACNGLSFGPSVGDAAVEMLYAACGGALYSVAVENGATQLRGAFGPGLRSSGDIAYLPGVGMFATLVADGGDILARIDLETGAAEQVPGDLGVAGLYGLAHYDGRLLAFGNRIARAIDPRSGVSVPVDASVVAMGATSGP